MIVRAIQLGDPVRPAALQAALGITAEAYRTADEATIGGMLADMTRRDIRADVLVGLFGTQGLVGACLLLELPGRAGLIAANWDAISEDALESLGLALRWGCEEAWSRGLVLVQVLPPASLDCWTLALKSGGFSRLTQLVYLRRRLPFAPSSVGAADNFEWVNYSTQQESLFISATEASYVESLDCPELTNLRSTRDSLAGHRAAGDFDPQLWLVARREKRPLGIVLLAGIESSNSIEIVYMGVAQPARRTGVASALLARAEELAHARSATSLTLAVDARNLPARRLYERAGFVEIGCREAWIATSDRNSSLKLTVPARARTC